MKNDIEAYLSERKVLVDTKLLEFLPDSSEDSSGLYESMRYSVLAGGKRLRPILCIAATEGVGGAVESALPLACAIEMIHTYSLIHDDLPSMDDDLLRRGKPTNHSVYGEAMAILAGDALLTDAFFLISNEGFAQGLSPSILIEVIKDISRAAGSRGMVKGQAIDLSLEGYQYVTLETSEKIHSLKTGALIEASVIIGGKIGGANNFQLSKLKSYSRRIGLAFQIIDDILDIEGGGEIGKSRGADQRKKKVTYPAIIGLEKSREVALKLTQEAVEALNGFDEKAQPLREIAFYLVVRKH